MASERRKRRAPLESVSRFDVDKTLKLGLEMLRAANARHALAGRLAVFVHAPGAARRLPVEEVEFTVHHEDMDRAIEAAWERGYRVSALPLGVRITTPAGPVDLLDGHRRETGDHGNSKGRDDGEDA